jgi:hypothetical protein
MKVIPLLLLTVLLCSPASAEELTTGNLVPGISDFTTSGGTSFGTGSGCSSGAYCTSGTTGGGGTYTSSFDVPLTEAELNQGFTLNSALTVSSHQSNSVLSSCSDGVLQSGDCRDIFRLTVTLQDAGTTVESFVHSEEMDFSGLQNFTFTDVVATNNYGVLTGIYELFGIDAGFPSGFYGPQFSNPSLTIDYQTAFVQEEVLTAITEQIETQTQDVIQATVAPEPAPLPPPPLAEPVVALATFDTVTVSAPPVDVPPVVVVDIPTTETLTPTSSVATVAPPPPEPVAPTIQPLAPVSETQQAQESTAEAQIEAAVEAPAPEPTVEAAAPEPTVEAPAPEPAETEVAEVAEVAPEPAEAEAEAETEVAEVAPEPAEAETESEQPESKATSKATARRKVAPTSMSKVSVAAVTVPVTPAVAAQTVVDAIAPSQKYGAAAQTVTLIAMGVIAENRALFKGPGIPDAAAGFFSTSTIPDGPSIVDRMTNYRFSGQANAAHSALVESQWRN